MTGVQTCALPISWFEQEHQQLGIAFPELKERIDRFEEAVQIVRGLLTTDDFSFEGEHYTIEHATLLPRPVQQPHPPIWIGASGERRMMPIAARYADAWHCFGGVRELTEKSNKLSAMAEAAGRDPSEIMRAGSLSLEDDADKIASRIDRWRDAGFEYLVCGWPAGGHAPIEEFASRHLGA